MKPFKLQLMLPDGKIRELTSVKAAEDFIKAASGEEVWCVYKPVGSNNVPAPCPNSGHPITMLTVDPKLTNSGVRLPVCETCGKEYIRPRGKKLVNLGQDIAAAIRNYEKARIDEIRTRKNEEAARKADGEAKKEAERSSWDGFERMISTHRIEDAKDSEAYKALASISKESSPVTAETPTPDTAPPSNPKRVMPVQPDDADDRSPRKEKGSRRGKPKGSRSEAVRKEIDADLQRTGSEVPDPTE